MTLAASELDRILSNPFSALPESKTLLLIGMIRAAQSSDHFDFALGNTGTWVSIPRSLVTEVKALGVRDVQGNPHTVSELSLQRPDGEAPWFDLLTYTLQRASSLLKRSSCNCTAASHGSLPASQASSGMIVNSGPSTGKCVYCWIYVGDAQECWELGAC